MVATVAVDAVGIFCRPAVASLPTPTATARASLEKEWAALEVGHPSGRRGRAYSLSWLILAPDAARLNHPAGLCVPTEQRPSPAPGSRYRTWMKASKSTTRELTRWGLGGCKVVVEVRVISSVNPLNKLGFACEVVEVGVVQQTCEMNGYTNKGGERE